MTVSTRRWGWALGVVALVGCDSGGATGRLDGGGPDDARVQGDAAAARDGGIPDSGSRDSGARDSGARDSGSRDAELEALDGAVDGALTPPDAGLAPDAAVGTPTCPEVVFSPVPAGLDPFYRRHVDVGGVPLVSSAGVPDEAFRVAVYLIEHMLRDRPCVRAGLVRNGIRIGILDRDEVTTNLPEYRDFYEAFPGVDWDRRGRGFGATAVRPLTSTAVENLLQEPGDPWRGELILLHELAHTIFEFGVEDQVGGPEQRARLERIYQEAMAAGRWADTYAATNANEYWAEGVQSWLDNNLSADPPDGIHGPVDTRAELAVYDPALAELIGDVFPAERWPITCDPSGPGRPWVPPAPGVGRCAWQVAVPPPVACGVALRSQNSDTPAELTFVNRRFDPVDVVWLDFDGVAQPFGRLPPRSTQSLGSFASHPWRFNTVDGRCLGQAVTEGGTNRMIVP